MQITVAHKVWDNNSICLDVYGKFIYMAQFSSNFPVENDNCWFLFLSFINTLMKLWKLLSCLSIFVLPRAILKIVSVNARVKKQLLIACRFFSALNKCSHHQHHYVMERFLLNISTE